MFAVSSLQSTQILPARNLKRLARQAFFQLRYLNQHDATVHLLRSNMQMIFLDAGHIGARAISGLVKAHVTSGCMASGNGSLAAHPPSYCFWAMAVVFDRHRRVSVDFGPCLACLRQLGSFDVMLIYRRHDSQRFGVCVGQRRDLGL